MLFPFVQTCNEDCTTGEIKRKKKKDFFFYNSCYFAGMSRLHDCPEVLWENKETFFPSSLLVLESFLSE